MLPRLYCTTRIADSLNLLAAIIKTRSTIGLNDAAHNLETIIARVLNEVFNLDLENLNVQKANYPAADLGDIARKRAFQVTVQNTGAKVRDTVQKAIDNQLDKSFNHLTIFFLLAKAPALPEKLSRAGRLRIDTLDIPRVVEAANQIDDLKRLRRIVEILDEEIGFASLQQEKASTPVQAKLYACFQEEDGQLVSEENKGDVPASYGMDLWVVGAPESTKKVSFEILDKNVGGRSWKLTRNPGAPRKFLADDLFLWGSVDIWACGICDDRSEWFIQSNLYEALKQYYGEAPNDENICRALYQFRDN